MDEKTQQRLDRALRALLTMGPVLHKETRFTQKDLDRKFRMRTNRKGTGRIEEL